jgi:hypothetical protein
MKTNEQIGEAYVCHALVRPKLEASRIWLSAQDCAEKLGYISVAGLTRCPVPATVDWALMGFRKSHTSLIAA